MTQAIDPTQTEANPLIPQRATLPDAGEARELPALPDHDPHEGAPADTAAPRPAAPRSVTEIPVDQHIDVPDPYEGVESARQGFVREPFGEPHLKLQAPARAGFRRYWFNDEPGRVQRALAAGYSFVKVNGRNTRNVVGRARNGQAQVAYLMEIPQAWFEQDMARQQAKVDEIDAAIKGGHIGAKQGELTKDGDNRYVPKEGITYEPKRA
jgi:hypothetical protein